MTALTRPVTSRRTTLHFGVLVQPYRARGLSTGDVAGFLEAKYGIMNAFYRVKGDKIGDFMANSVAGALESLMMGETIDPWAHGTQMIENEFREFISSKEAEKVGIPGTPTQAALRGVNHRLKHPYAKKNPRRPSFNDTGLYMNSFRAWME